MQRQNFFEKFASFFIAATEKGTTHAVDAGEMVKFHANAAVEVDINMSLRLIER